MIHKIFNSSHNGRGYCGHIIRKGEDYFIVKVGKELHAKCQKCMGAVKHFISIRLPDDLVEGAIPVK